MKEKQSIRISMVMIVKDREKDLEKCLDSFLPITNEEWCELIVVDTGSKDRTIDVAKRHRAEVYKKEFIPWDFGAARNYAISKAKGEWLLIIDSDEILPQECLYEFKEMLWNPGYDKFPARFLFIMNIFSQNNLETSNLLQPRIFRNDPDFKYDGDVHNKPTAKPPYFFAPKTVYLNHYGYQFENNPELTKEKFDRSMPLLLKQYEDHPHDTHIITHIVKTYRIIADFDNVIKYCLIWFEEMGKVEYHEGWFAYLEVFIDLVDAYLRQDNIKEAEKTLKKSLKYSDRLPDIHALMGGWYSKKGMEANNAEYMEKAREHYERALKIATTTGSAYENLITSNIELAAPKLLLWLAIYYYQKAKATKGKEKKENFRIAGIHVNNGIELNRKLPRLNWDIHNCKQKIYKG